MNDFTTRDAVAWILDRMGFKQMAEDAKNELTNIDVYINYIKYQDRQYGEIRDFINYYF